MLGHLLQEELGRQPLALQAALHVGEGEHDGVDLARTDRGPQFLEGQQAAPPAGLGWHQTESSLSIAASSSAEPWTFGPLNQFFAETAQ